MSDNNTSESRETILQIVAEMRLKARHFEQNGKLMVSESALALFLEPIASRLEAAWKWESKEIATEHAVLPAVCITHKPVGNAAAMREALLEATERLIRIVGCDHYEFHRDKHSCDFKTTMGECRNRRICETIFKAQAALSAPLRNCDMYDSYGDAIRAFDDSEDAENYEEMAEWLFAPAQEGAGDGK